MRLHFITMAPEELEFVRLGFERQTDRYDNPRFGEKGEPLYVKGFWKNHEGYGYSSCYMINGSRDPDTSQYELHLDPGLPDKRKLREFSDRVKESIGDEAVAPPLEDVVRQFKEARGISESVNIGLELSIEYSPTHLSIRGSDLGQIYADFERALIGLGYLNKSIEDRPSAIIKGYQVGLV